VQTASGAAVHLILIQHVFQLQNLPVGAGVGIAGQRGHHPALFIDTQDVVHKGAHRHRPYLGSQAPGLVQDLVNGLKGQSADGLGIGGAGAVPPLEQAQRPSGDDLSVQFAFTIKKQTF
jgi:hypothetical protein